MDFFERILDLEEIITLVTGENDSGNSSSENVGNVFNGRRTARITKKTRKMGTGYVKKSSKRKREYSAKRSAYYSDLHSRKMDYIYAARTYIESGKDVNFIFGINTPPEMKRYEEKKWGIPFLHTCMKNLHTFRMLLDCDVDLYVRDNEGRTIRDIYLNKDVRVFITQHGIMELS